MKKTADTTDRQRYLEERIRYLEEANHTYVALLDMLASSESFQSELEFGNSTRAIFTATLAQARRLLPFTSLGILECQEDSSFEFVVSEPSRSRAEQSALVNGLIMNGTFASALNRNQAIVAPTPGGSHSCLLHVIATPKRIRGMFFGQLEKNRRALDSPTLNALTTVLRSAAHALESCVLYDLLQAHLHTVEQTVRQRTSELREAKQRAEEMALELKTSNERLEMLCYTDPLTCLYNRRFLMNDLEREFHRSKRKNKSLCLLVLDIDHFKRVNDTYGHQNGDLVIREVAEVCRMMMRHSDLVARYGGEEFVVLLPETSLADGVLIADRLRNETLALRFPAPMEQLTVSISVGVACFPGDGVDCADTLFQHADEALLRAKRQGRNRVVVTS